MATAARLITVAELLARPEIAAGYEELRQGEIAFVEWPRFWHSSLQHRIQDVLQRAIGDAVIAFAGLPFRVRPEYELRRAGVGVFSRERWEVTDPEDFFRGSPKIVIEVGLPSNTAREFQEKEGLCLATGSIAFWVVYPDLRIVTVAMAEGGRTYRDGDEIEIRGFAGKRVAVSELLRPARA